MVWHNLSHANLVSLVLTRCRTERQPAESASTARSHLDLGHHHLEIAKVSQWAFITFKQLLTLTDVLAACRPGFYSNTGVAPCAKCPMNKYQPLSGRKSCISCPYGKSTLASGSTSLNQCVGECCTQLIRCLQCLITTQLQIYTPACICNTSMVTCYCSLSPSLHPRIPAYQHPSLTPSHLPSLTPSHLPSLTPSLLSSLPPSLSPSLPPSLSLPLYLPPLSPSLILFTYHIFYPALSIHSLWFLCIWILMFEVLYYLLTSCYLSHWLHHFIMFLCCLCCSKERVQLQPMHEWWSVRRRR